MRTLLYPYKKGSRSAKALANAMDIKIMRMEGPFNPKRDVRIINWGNTRMKREITSQHEVTVLNPPVKTSNAVNKLSFFRKLRESGLTPKFWTQEDKDEITDEDYPIVCRTILNGSGGAGIVIADTPADLVDAPLYVKYIKKDKEFRIHLGKGSSLITICQQRKVRKTGVEVTNWRVRNIENGFIYQRHGIEVPQEVMTVAQQTLLALDLDFAAIDIIYTKTGEAYALEANTAPGLEGQTVHDYASFFSLIGD